MVSAHAVEFLWFFLSYLFFSDSLIGVSVGGMMKVWKLTDIDKKVSNIKAKFLIFH